MGGGWRVRKKMLTTDKQDFHTVILHSRSYLKAVVRELLESSPSLADATQVLKYISIKISVTITINISGIPPPPGQVLFSFDRLLFWALLLELTVQISIASMFIEQISSKIMLKILCIAERQCPANNWYAEFTFLSLWDHPSLLNLFKHMNLSRPCLILIQRCESEL